MGKFNFPGMRMSGSRPDDEEPRQPRIGPGGGKLTTLFAFVLMLLIIYGGYYWFIRRVVVGPGQVLVLIKKDGHQSLKNDQIIIPRPADTDAARAAWDEQLGDTNGLEI